MILTDEQLECARALAAVDGLDTDWLDQRVSEYLSCLAFGDDIDLAEAGQRIFDEAPEWIGVQLFGHGFETRAAD